jgi:translation initiation factor 1
MDNSKHRLVWSDDPKDKPNVEGKSAIKKPKGDAGGVVIPGGWVAVMRVEKKHRGGKTVTVIDRMPKHETFLRELCKELKSKCGSGGTVVLEGEHGQIEIQGDKREMIRTIFEKKGFRLKG